MVYDEEMGISDLALHIQNLRVFFKLYFGAESFDAGIKTALEECIIEVYRDFHITWDTEIAFLQPEDYPVIRDLYNKVEEKSKKPDLSQYKQSVYDRTDADLREIWHQAYRSLSSCRSLPPSVC